MAFHRRLKRKIKSLRLTPAIIFRKIYLRISNHINWLLGPIRGEYSFPPESVGFHLTKRCNLRCQMCFLWANKENPGEILRRYKKEEMPIKRWLEIVDELAPYKPSIGISGGESLLYEGIIEIISYIKQKGMYLSINTNGMLLEKYTEDIVESKLDMVRVSIDGPPEIHDEIRGVTGSFARLMKGIDALNKLKSEKSLSLPVIEVYFTMTKQNFTYLTDVLELIENKNINGIKFIHPLYMGENNIQECINFMHEIFPEQNMDYLKGADIENVQLNPEKLLVEINKVKQRKNKLSVWFFPDFNNEQTFEYYNNHHNFAFKFKGKCHVPWFTANIKPNGDVESCPDFTVGNVSTEKFLNVWNNDKIKKLRSLLRKNGIFPICHGCCNTYRYL